MFNTIHVQYLSVGRNVADSILSALHWKVLRSEGNQKEYDKLAKVYKTLIFSSRIIANDLMLHTTEPTHCTRTNAHVLLFTHCWEILSKGPNATLPAYDMIFDHGAKLNNSTKFRNL